jgi:hypothetical protein
MARIPRASDAGIGRQPITSQAPSAFQQAVIPSPLAYLGSTGNQLTNIAFAKQQQINEYEAKQKQKEIVSKGNSTVLEFNKLAADIQQQWDESGKYGDDYSEGLMLDVQNAWDDYKESTEIDKDVLDYVDPEVNQFIFRMSLKARETGLNLSDQYGRANLQALLDSKIDQYTDAHPDDRPEIKASILSDLNDSRNFYDPEQYAKLVMETQDNLRWNSFTHDLAQNAQATLDKVDSYGFQGIDRDKAVQSGERIVQAQELDRQQEIAKRERDYQEAINRKYIFKQMDLSEKMISGTATHADYVNGITELKRDFEKGYNPESGFRFFSFYANGLQSLMIENEKRQAMANLINSPGRLDPKDKDSQDAVNMAWEQLESQMADFPIEQKAQVLVQSLVDPKGIIPDSVAGSIRIANQSRDEETVKNGLAYYNVIRSNPNTVRALQQFSSSDMEFLLPVSNLVENGLPLKQAIETVTQREQMDPDELKARSKLSEVGNKDFNQAVDSALASSNIIGEPGWVEYFTFRGMGKLPKTTIVADAQNLARQLHQSNSRLTIDDAADEAARYVTNSLYAFTRVGENRVMKHAPELLLGFDDMQPVNDQIKEDLVRSIGLPENTKYRLQADNATIMMNPPSWKVEVDVDKNGLWEDVQDYRFFFDPRRLELKQEYQKTLDVESARVEKEHQEFLSAMMDREGEKLRNQIQKFKTKLSDISPEDIEKISKIRPSDTLLKKALP